ncbi:hypothetical protein BDP81DRAFT_25318 [Colletotrichum phormii]|uniref:Uncharacterized protein n=1 Tax=Colletotrichum phormii TaxID=359342 RepID=A0AAI9ZR13_9PEZI|nr:uncharacterized protein BDP81DRAFT_25318 [Colletotrichum phormii]KAK1636601.1 hypothetical protein BDP81DRAFT_25318 [Colletotrichum phormii]
MICPGHDFKRPRSSTLRIATDGFATAVWELRRSPSAKRFIPGNPQPPGYTRIPGTQASGLESWAATAPENGRFGPGLPCTSVLHDRLPCASLMSWLNWTIEMNSNVNSLVKNRLWHILCSNPHYAVNYWVTEHLVLTYCVKVLFSCEVQEPDPPLQLVGD